MVPIDLLMLTDGAAIYTCQDRMVSKGAVLARAISLNTGELLWESARVVATFSKTYECVTSDGVVVCAFQTKVRVLMVRPHSLPLLTE